MKKSMILFVALCMSISFFSQEKILLEIDNEKITADEFLHIYKKNNTNADAMSYAAMKEYMDLFINFKLKVHEAEVYGLDTLASFKQELSGYRSQLAQPYLTDKKVEEDLVAEAYERMKWDIEVSHILIKCEPTASPADSLKAWNKINDVYNKLVKGSDFVKMVKDYSEDDGSKITDGSLGYRTVFGLIYEFETVMYETPVGQFSKPFRTRFGYHILKVTDKRPAKGKYKVAHIMMVVPKDSGSALDEKAQKTINELLVKARSGEDFAKLAEEFSEDRRTATDGGTLGWVTVGGKMIKEFEDAVFSLEKVGDISEVLKTSYGYHIIKLLEIEPIKPFDELKSELKSKISNTARTSKSRDAIVATLMTEYNAVTFEKNVADFYKIVTDSIFVGSWTIDEKTDLSKTVLTFKDKVYTQKDFADYLMKFNRKQSPQNVNVFVDQSYKNFVSKMIIMYEEEILEDKYPAFRYLIKEYHDGILLFELTDKTVWSKAITDTVGLEKFYSENKNNYMWGYRYDLKRYKCKDSKITKAANKSFLKGVPEDKIFAKINKKDSAAIVVTESNLGEKGVKPLIDFYVKEYNIPETDGHLTVIANYEDNTIAVIKVKGPEVKSLSEAKGLITADYQNYLEKAWIQELRNKYKVTVHDDVLKSLAK
ncbi:MAG: peptidylprolyl isomerase [Bacteroidales bacterium]|nr:peptidylprolyl isomerase [Bacteroidales bacterium]